MRCLVLVLCVACGKIAFDPLHDASGGSDSDGPPSDALDSDLLLDFTFESDVLLDSGPGHHTATCMTCPTIGAGRVGAGGAVFNGVECITVQDAPDLHPPVLTFALWVLSVTPQRSTTFSRPQNGATDTTDTIEMYVDVMNNWNLGVSSTYAPAGVITDGGWHHVAGTYDGGTLDVYLDGAYTNTAVAPPPVYAADNYLIGCDINLGNPEEPFTGTLDEVRLYDRVLAPAEIAALAGM